MLMQHRYSSRAQFDAIFVSLPQAHGEVTPHRTDGDQKKVQNNKDLLRTKRQRYVIYRGGFNGRSNNTSDNTQPTCC
jgi:hypothetical protein